MDLKQYIKSEGLKLGFSKIGIAPAGYQPASHNNFLTWLNNEYQAGMSYLERSTRKRFDPKIHMPNASSVIVCAHNYHTEPTDDPNYGYVSIYARGDDYHIVIREKLELLCERIESEYGEFKFKTYVDSSPISEKTFAVLAGIGFIGRNNTIIIPKDKFDEQSPRGSFHFLGVIIANLEIEPDDPIAGTCGKCHKCIDACPTDAIVADHTIDARKCISYHTTQNKGEIPDDISDKMNNIVLGCDICQTVCPYNSKAILTDEPRFAPKDYLIDFDPSEFLEQANDVLAKKYAGTIVSDLGFERMKRNTKVALHNMDRSKP